MPGFRFKRITPSFWRRYRARARQRQAAALIAQSRYFNTDFYLTHSTDVAAEPRWAENPALHYLLHGGREGRQPSDCFDSAWYLARYPDVKAANFNPLWHFMCHGYDEGRMPRALRAMTWHQRLWSGSSDAESSALLGLEGLLRIREGCEQEASAAAWSLGRWYAWRDQWADAARVMARFCEIEHPVPGHLAPRLLDIDAAIRTGELSDARQRLKQLLASLPGCADLLLLGSNLARAEAGANGTIETERQRLAWINRPYVANDLEPLCLMEDRPSANGAAILTLDRLVTCARESHFLPHQSSPRSRTDPLVSVIVPAWNAAKTLETALNGLAAQTWTALEVLVVDDRSSDDTAALAERFSSRDPRFRLLRHTTNQGAYVARNTGLASARGAFITTHDSDDWSHPRKIETQILPLLASDELAATVSHWVRVTTDLQFGQWSTHEGWMGWVHRNVSSLMFKRSVFEQLGYWDRVTISADTEYYYRIIHAFGSAAVKEILPGVPLSFARHDPGSLTQRQKTSVRTVFGGVRKEYQEAAERWHKEAQAPSDLYLSAYPERRPFPAPRGISRCTDGLESPSTPAIAAVPKASAAVLMPKALVFVHIPKTAGTSFREACSAYFGESTVHCDYGAKQRQTSPLVRTWAYESPDFFELARELQEAHCRLICGHVPLHRFVALVGLLNTLAFVRHPVERVMSHFEHHRRHLGYSGTLDEFIALPAHQNLQSRLLSSAPVEAIGFLGATERYEESLALINETYGTRLAALASNCHPKRGEMGRYAASGEIAQRILDLNRSDASLFARVNQLLDARHTAFELAHPFVHGAIQDVKPKLVSGFAMMRNHTMPVMVELTVNEQSVASTAATAQRPTLRALGAPRHGCVGFDFNLRKPLAQGDRIQCMAAPSGQSLGSRTWQPHAPPKTV